MDPASFDHIADQYDMDFTHSRIGQLQRKAVWDYLDCFVEQYSNALQENQGKSLKILELNCGTGEDALRFAQKEHQVLATDLSSKMVNVTNTKIIQNHLTDFVETLKIGIEDISPENVGQDYDLVFSNFGGLNCIQSDDLLNLSLELSKILKPKGHFIAVVMPNYCMMESLYFLAKFQGKKILRRSNPKGLPVNVEGQSVHTWYYSPQQFYKHFTEHFKNIAQKPIGLFVPPSYMEPYFRTKPKQLNALNTLDQSLNRFSTTARIADHFLIDLERK